MEKIKLVKELSYLIEEYITEQDVYRINLNEVILKFINSHNIKNVKEIENEMLTNLIDFIKINNDVSRIEIW